MSRSGRGRNLKKQQMSNEAARAVLKHLFAAQRLCVLATQGSGQPYGSLVAFAETDDLMQLVFTTRRDSRKFANLTADPRVALLIDSRSNSDTDFRDAVAVTAVGSAREASGGERDSLAKIYLAKHPYLAEFVESPGMAVCLADIEDYVIARFTEVTRLRMER